MKPRTCVRIEFENKFITVEFTIPETNTQKILYIEAMKEEMDLHPFILMFRPNKLRELIRMNYIRRCFAHYESVRKSLLKFYDESDEIMIKLRRDFLKEVKIIE